MKTLVFVLMVLLAASFQPAFAQNHNKCMECNEYVSNGDEKGYFENVRQNLEEDLRAGKVDKSGKRISRYNLLELLVQIGVHLRCVEERCPAQYKTMKKIAERIVVIISNGRLASPMSSLQVKQ